MYQPYYDQGVMILDCGLYATRGDAVQWKDSLGLTYPVLYDPETSVAPLFLPDYGGFYVAPHSFILDDTQTLWFQHFNYSPGFYTEFILVIESLIVPELGANVEAIDFGDVNIGESASFEVYLDNVRTGIVNVTSATVSDPQFSVDFTPGDIYSVEDEMLVTVTYTPTEAGTISDNLVIESSGGNLTILLDGNGMLSVGDEPEQNTPANFALEGNFPNPFNSSTEFQFSLPSDENVKVDIFSIDGKLVDEIGASHYSAGSHTLNYSAGDLISGVYFARLTAGNNSAVTKMVLLK